ncbi:MAG: glycosyltransferase [Brumimicrobium sp.]
MNDPLISIIIPVYNRVKLIQETIDSVLAQTYSNWECIVVDDDSTDNTWPVLKEYSRKDARIKIYKRNRKPKGATSCRNIGAELSEGEYLMFWDSDDILAPWCLQERASFMKDNPNLDLGIFQLLGMVSNGESFLSYDTEEDEHLKGFLSFRNTWGTPAVIWRKEFYNSTGGWNERAKTWQDPEIHIRALLKEPKFEWGSKVPDGIIRHGIDKNSISVASKETLLFTNRMHVINEVMPLLKPQYREIFKRAVKAVIWSKTYNFNWIDKLEAIYNARESGIISGGELQTYLLTYRLYNFIKKAPLLRGAYYRLFIEPHFKGFILKQTGKIGANIMQELLMRTSQLKPDNSFRKQIETALKVNL